MLILIVVVAFMGLSFDAGFWFFDHRTAQNQAEAAALAAVLELPALPANVGTATGQADSNLTANGAAATSSGSCPVSGTGTHIQYADLTGDGKMDSVTVCVRRQSPSLFSRLTGISFVHVSAQATARTGPVDSTNVMPWAVIAPDPDCNEAAHRNCKYDANLDGDFTDPGDCNASFTVCPFGLTADRLYTFKANVGGVLGSNTGIIAVCGNGANSYGDCLSGASSSGFFSVGDEVAVDTQPGQISNKTDDGLSARAPTATWASPGRTNCDVTSRPSILTTQSWGQDTTGKAAATTKFVNPASHPECAYRLVPIPVVKQISSNGRITVIVVGFASFGVANWDRDQGGQNVMAATSTDGTCHPVKKNQLDPTKDFECGAVWGYLFTGVTPPDALLNQIGSSNNPFAPLLIALVD
jgi:hypothetical protein